MTVNQLVLETERLHLRFPTQADAQAIASLANNINIARMVAAVKHPYDIEDALEWLGRINDNHENLLHITFMICLNHTTDKKGTIIGTCGAKHRKQQSYDLGYWIGEDYWNKGYATEAVTALVDFLRKKREAKYIGAWYANENIASKRVLEKAGLAFHGKEQDIYSLGRGCDVPCRLMEMDLKSKR